MMWNWSGFAAVAENPDLSKIVGRTKTTLMPRDGGLRGRSVSLNIYWVLCIAIGSRHKEEAYRFMRHVASKEMDKATSMLGGNGTRLSTWRDAEVRKSFPYYAIIEEIHREVASPPKIAAFPIIAESLNHMVDDVLNQRMEVLPALDRAAKEVQELWAK